jgi:hypothetical protein
MARLNRFEKHRFLGNRLNMKVYDCDNDEQFKSLEVLFVEKEMLKNNKIQSFSPDSLNEAINRGYKPL